MRTLLLVTEAFPSSTISATLPEGFPPPHRQLYVATEIGSEYVYSAVVNLRTRLLALLRVCLPSYISRCGKRSVEDDKNSDKGGLGWFVSLTKMSLYTVSLLSSLSSAVRQPSNGF
ncbi:hypothetical protein AcV7_005902 [Taiwanofungus camphoratus]|nr:hypothetical protein AcV7_005902 [Antrodia cinnamomea]